MPRTGNAVLAYDAANEIGLGIAIAGRPGRREVKCAQMIAMK